jgi:ATP-binding cassette subfamily B protein
MRIFVRLLGFLRPYRGRLAWTLLLAGLAIGATVAIPYLTGRAIDRIGSGDRTGLTVLAAVIGAVGVARLALTVGRRLVAGHVSLGVEYDLRQRLYEHLQGLELGFFDHWQTGQLMSRVTVDLQAVRFFLGYGVVFIVQSALTLVLAGIAMFALQPELAAVALWPVPLVVAIAFRYGRRARPALQEVQQRIAELTADAEENVSGVRVVKAFAREARQLARFHHSVGRVFHQSMYATRLRSFYNPFIGFLPNLGLAAILFIGGREVIRGTITKGEFAAFYTYLLMLIAPMRTLGMMLGVSQRATASGARIFELLDRAPRLVSAPDAPGLPAGDGEIALSDAELRFASGARPVLADVSLHVRAGSTVALVGPSGSGKTTLAALVSRLYDVTAGSVSIDGADVRDVAVDSVRGAVAVVTDDPFLFSATVHDNIAYARPEATRAEVVQAARRAQADAFVRALPDGYDTPVGERGFTLSGGQRQRLAIARALVAEPRILILDDATSSVDASTEQQIKLALRELMRGRTTLIIAHRLSTIALADEIVVLDRGAVVAQGTHDELLEVSPFYREVVERGAPDRVDVAEAAEAVG